MQQQIRTFVALKVDAGEKLLEEFGKLKALLKGEQINWVPRENLHLTLRFIGNTSRTQLYDLVDGLCQVATETGAFDICVRGTGYFKQRGIPRVLFAGIEAGKPLQQLAQRVDNVAVDAGFQPNAKVFRPHLTLGRIKQLKNRLRFAEITSAFVEMEYHYQRIDGFVLYQCILRSEGPVYKVIREFPFAGASPV